VGGWQRHYVDLPGCGRSPVVEPRSDSVVDAVIGFLHATFGATPVALAGCSYGGYVAAAIARREPARVAGLLLVCSGVKILPAHRRLPPPPSEAGPDGWLDAVPAEWHDHLEVSVGSRTAETAGRVAAVLTSASTGDEGFLGQLRSTGYQLSDEESTATYAGPVSVVAGREDRIAGYHDQFDLLDRFPAADYAALSGAGHYLPFERPAAFRSIVVEWLHRAGSD
jgi:pimeloyl-ACP methyl ester carboxylesterase